jgi:hypothetical protein
VLTEVIIYLCLAKYNILNNDNISTTQNSYKIINGVIGSICFIFLFSRIIGSFTTVLPYKNILLPFLYLYCSVQPLYFMVNAIVSNDDFKNVVSIVVLIIALIGKYLLYISITWLFQTKRILFHFIETHQLRTEIDKEIKLFDEIWKSDDEKKVSH